MPVDLHHLPQQVIERDFSAFQRTSSKMEFEITLASKFQLLKCRMEQSKKLNDFFSLLSRKAIEAKENGEIFGDKECSELAESFGLSDMIIKSLNGLINNYYVGGRAKYLINLMDEKQNEKFESEFDQIESEVKADIEIAKSLGIDVSLYDQAFHDYAFDRMMMLIWVSILTKKESDSND